MPSTQAAAKVEPSLIVMNAVGATLDDFTVMGSTDPTGMSVTADQIAGQLRQERIDSILLSPV